MSRFQQQGALEYDSRISTLVPAYKVLHLISAAMLKTRLPENARVLVVGAGTGAEILALAAQNPHWQITALEPSADMLALARQKCVAAGLGNVVFFTGYVTDLPVAAPFDAALCLLVMHFIETVAAKQQFLTEIAAHLNVGAPLLLGDLMQFDTTEHTALVHYAVGQGLPEEYGAALRQRLMREFFTVSLATLTQLAVAAGLTTPENYFRALGFAAFVMDKNAEHPNQNNER